MDFSPPVIGLIGIIFLLVLLFLKMPGGIALLLVSIGGIWAASGLPQAMYILANATYKTSTTYVWSLIPLFILMGNISYQTGLGKDLFECARKWVGHLPGGLAVTAIGASAGFGAICGDNIASAVTMTSVCLPEMRKNKYADSLSLGAICAGGILSFLIPPSLGFILYGILTNTSISDLFMAGVFPGILTALLYVVVIFILSYRNPALGPKGPYINWKQRFLSLRQLWGILILVVIVFGGIYSGFITATEAGALGAFGSILVGVFKRTMSWNGFRLAVNATIGTTGMIFLLVIGAWVFAPFLSMCNLPQTLAGFMANWSPWIIIIAILIFYFLGGLIFESTILMIITIPIFLPLLTAARIDLIWFGVCLMLIVVLGGNSPPVGLIVYATAGMVKDVSVGTIFKGVLPFIPAVIVATILVLLFPSIATWLPTVLS